MAKFKKWSGCVSFRHVDEDGNPVDASAGWFPLGEADPLSLSLSEDLVKFYGRTCTTAGQVVGSVTKPADATGTMTVYDFAPENVAVALKAEAVVNTVSGSTVNATVTIGVYNRQYNIGTEYLSNVVVTDAGSTVLTAGIDYAVDEYRGLIQALPGGAISEGDIVTVAATGGANTDTIYNIGAGSSAMVEITGTLIDEFTGKEAMLHLFMVRMTLSSEFVFVSSDDTDREQLDFELAPQVRPGMSYIGTFGGSAIA